MKSKAELANIDIALATEARGMYSRLLKQDSLERIRAMSTPEELLAFLRRSEGWGRAMRELPAGPVADTQFALQIERELYQEYEWLYRFSQGASKSFLIFLALQVKSRAIIAALRRLISPGEPVFEDPLPPFFRNTKGFDIRLIEKATTFEEIVKAGGDGIFGDTLRAMELDPETGLPALPEAMAALESRFYAKLAEFLEKQYDGPDRAGLLSAVGFRVDARNARYLLRLRRWGSDAEKANALLLPLHSGLSEKRVRQILEAETDEEAMHVVTHMLGIRKGEVPADLPPDKFISAAEFAHFRRVMHGRPALSTAYAFLVLKELEGNMLKRVYIALEYGVDLSSYMY